MAIIVQKFGGTSVADSEKILSAAKKALATQKAGNQVVMVVSAMGKNTDMLVDLARQLNSRPPAREMDMLLSTGEQVSVALMAMATEPADRYQTVSEFQQAVREFEATDLEHGLLVRRVRIGNKLGQVFHPVVIRIHCGVRSVRLVESVLIFPIIGHPVRIVIQIEKIRFPVGI